MAEKSDVSSRRRELHTWLFLAVVELSERTPRLWQ